MRELPHPKDSRTVWLSVLLCAYNEGHQISKTLDSLKNQTCDFRIEIIGVDNGSNDNTQHYLNLYCEKTTICNDRGKIPCLSNGLEFCTGCVVAIVDADTIYPEHWAQQIYESFRSNEDLVLVFGPTPSPAKDGHIRRSIYSFFVYVSFAFRVGCAVGFNMAFKRKQFRKILEVYDGGALSGWGLGTVALRLFGKSSVRYNSNLIVPKNMNRIVGRGYISSIALWVGEWTRLALGLKLGVSEAQYYGFEDRKNN